MHDLGLFLIMFVGIFGGFFIFAILIGELDSREKEKRRKERIEFEKRKELQ